MHTKEDFVHEPIFSKRVRTSSHFRLSVFLAAALVGHLLLFYLFQVGYPTSRRLVRQPGGITVFSGSTPGVMPILHHIEAHTPYFDAGFPEEDDLAITKEHFVSDYVATYNGYEPELYSQTETAFAGIPNWSFLSSTSTLPSRVVGDPVKDSAVSASPKEVYPKESFPQPVLWKVSQPGDTKNIELGTLTFEKQALEQLTNYGDNIDIQIGVGSTGRVEFVGILSVLPSEIGTPN